MRFWSSMKAAVSARLAEPARLSTTSRAAGPSPLRTMRRERPVTSATRSVPKRWTIWSSAPGTGGKRGQLFDQRIAPAGGLAAFDRLAIAHDGPRRQIALAVGEGLVELHREGMGEVVEDVFPRRDVDADVVPLLGRDLRQAAFHQRLAGRDDLDDGRMACREIGLDGWRSGWGFSSRSADGRRSAAWRTRRPSARRIWPGGSACR